MTQETQTPAMTPVWDWPVRAVHWAMVALVVGLIVTGLIGGEIMVWHMRMGETLLALVLFRLLWGVAGSSNARFASFLRGPRAVIRYAGSLARRQHEAHATHNPLGGWMVIALLLVLLLQTGTGLFTNDDVLADGPLVKLISKDLSDAISSLHRRGWWVLVGLAVLHIGAVLSYFVLFRDNPVRPMLDGAKALPIELADPASSRASTPRALSLLALAAVVVWLIVNRL